MTTDAPVAARKFCINGISESKGNQSNTTDGIGLKKNKKRIIQTIYVTVILMAKIILLLDLILFRRATNLYKTL